MTQNVSLDSLRGECVRYSMWYHSNCSGAYIHSICNFGMAEIEKVYIFLISSLTLLFFWSRLQVRTSKCMIGNKVQEPPTKKI